MSNKLAGLAVAATLALGSGPVLAGGLARPNPISARSVGMGGAFSAIADDPTALHFNPAGLSRLRKSSIMVGGEFIVAPRTYEPDFEGCDADPAPARCQSPQEPTSPVRPLPSLGFATRLTQEGVPSRLAFGIGFWNTFGGQLVYEDSPPIPGTLAETRNAVLEIVPGIAYEINDVLAIGAALRVGIGLFDSVAVQRPNDAEMHATGIGAGGTLGVMVTPSDSMSIGAYYRTSLTVTTKGDGVIQQPTGPLDVSVEFKQPWPQQAGLGVAYRPADKLTVAAQIDWHGWGRVNSLDPTFAGEPELTRNARILTDWNNNYAIHAGVEFAASSKLALRGGYTYDSIAVTDRLRERQFLDGNSMFVALGGSYYITDAWRVDSAFETGIPAGAYTIENNSMDVSAWPQRANKAPGEHSGKLYTFELAVQYLY